MIQLHRSALFLLAVLCLPSAETAFANPPGDDVANQARDSKIHEYRSSHLHVRTDLPQQEAESLYIRLEQTLRYASRYWGKPPNGQIQCFVVDDLSAWTDAQLPHRLARVIIDGVGGATIPKMVGKGKQLRNQPTVFASSDRGVAEHELVHAYCICTFGSSGPEWYKEGMAEMTVSRSTRKSGIHCSEQQLTRLRNDDSVSLEKIFSTGDTGKRISASLRKMMDDPAHRGQHIRAEVWTDVDAANVATARDEYLHSWAFCYMMLHNPNYSKRFRSLGNAFVAEQREAFDDFFAPVRDQIEFEHRFFLKRASEGYRVDLCAWDWNHRFVSLASGKPHKTLTHADRGFQPSGVSVLRGERYNYLATGQWSLLSDGQLTDANGDEHHAGRLIGIVLNDHTLSEPFALGTSGTWRPTTSGNLYLRCEDAWNELADNTGQMKVTFTRN